MWSTLRSDGTSSQGSTLTETSTNVTALSEGSLYVIDTSAAGRLYRVAPHGTAGVVARSR
jgi:hypothetical protein